MSIPVLKSRHGRQLGIGNDGEAIADGGFVAGYPGKPQIVLPGSHDKVAFFTDFLGAALPDELTAIEGTDTGSDASIALTAVSGGAALLTTGKDDTGGSIGLVGALNYKANAGGLRMSARVRLPAITTESLFVGFTDTVAAEPPVFEDSGTGAQVSNATDAVGVLYDTHNSHTTPQLVAVKAGTDATPVDLADAPVANVYETFEVDVDKSGNAAFYRNGAYAGKIANAVTPTVALAPVVSLVPYNGATSMTAAVDYFNVAMNRDTGT